MKIYSQTPGAGSASNSSPLTGTKILMDEFLNTAVTGDTAWSAFNSGTAAAQAKIAGEPGHPGVVQISTGTTNSGRSGASKEFVSTITGTMMIAWAAVWRYGNIANTTDDYVWRAGWGDQTGNVDYTDSPGYLEYNRAANGHFFAFKSASNTSRTTVLLNGTSGISSIGVTLGQWYNAFCLTNDTGTKSDLYIGTNTNNQALVASITTNIPTGAGREFGPVYGIFKTAGTTAMTFDLDAFALMWDSSANR